MPQCDPFWLKLKIGEVDIPRFAKALNRDAMEKDFLLIEQVFKHERREPLPEEFLSKLSQINSLSEALHMCRSCECSPRDMFCAAMIRAAGFFRKTEAAVVAA